MKNTAKTAFVTGITGQDASLLASFLLEKNYHVHGLRLYAATGDTERIDSIVDHPHFHLHHGDLTDGLNLCRLLSDIRPDELYNLGAQSHVRVSFDADKPDGTPRKMMDSSRLLEMGWQPQTVLDEGLEMAWRWYLDHEKEETRCVA